MTEKGVRNEIDHLGLLGHKHLLNLPITYQSIVKAMPCRVGITTDPAKRKAYWESQVVGLKNWKILASYNAKSKAQEHEKRYADRYGCKLSLGGVDGRGSWSVYRFDYLRTKPKKS